MLLLTVQTYEQITHENYSLQRAMSQTDIKESLLAYYCTHIPESKNFQCIFIKDIKQILRFKSN